MARELLRAVTYTRVSTVQQAERGNTSTQLVDLDRVIRNEGYELVASLSDEGVSGRTLFDRPAFAKVVELAKARAFDILVVWDVDRIGRPEQRQEAAQLQDFFQEFGIRVHTPSSGLIDFANADQSLLAGIRLQMAAFDRIKILQRTAAGRLQKAKLGWKTGSTVPYGYRWVPSDSATRGSYQIVESEAAVIREAVELSLQGFGVGRIVGIFRERGHKTRAGEPFAKATLSKLLTRPMIMGEMVVLRRAEPGGVVIQVPPIIDRETWQRVQIARTDRKAPSKRMERGEYLLTGIAKCSVCGLAMWVSRNRPGKQAREYYRCSSTNNWKTFNMDGPCGQRHHEVQAIDRLVWQQVCQTLGDPDLLAKACSLPDTVGPDQTDAIQARLRILEDLEREVLQRRRLGAISKVACDSELEAISSERQSLERKVELLESDMRSKGQGRKVRQELLARAQQLLSEGNQDFQARRKLLRLLVPGNKHRVVVHLDGSVEIHGVLSLPSGVFKSTLVRVSGPTHTRIKQRKDPLTGQFLPGETKMWV